MDKQREFTEFEKAIYWHDYVDDEDLKSDLNNQVLVPCKKARIFLNNLKDFDTPQCLYDEDYEILFFDWGGMSLGNSLIEHFCRYIYKHAEDNPSKFFIMVSAFTKEAMKEAMKEFEKDKPFNLFLSISDLEDWLDKYHE